MKNKRRKIIGVRGMWMRCRKCGYEWSYNLYEDYCPNCGEDC